jgi:hypothetical protein
MFAAPVGPTSFFWGKDCGTFAPNVRPNQPGQVAIGLPRTNGGAAMRTAIFGASFSIVPQGSYPFPRLRIPVLFHVGSRSASQAGNPEMPRATASGRGFSLRVGRR